MAQSNLGKEGLIYLTYTSRLQPIIKKSRGRNLEGVGAETMVNTPCRLAFRLVFSW